MNSLSGSPPYGNSSLENCQTHSFSDFASAKKNEGANPSSPVISTPPAAADEQDFQKGDVQSIIDAEREEVIRGSLIEWSPDFLRLLRGGSEKEFPDCFDGTPIKSKLRSQPFLPTKPDYLKFMQEFAVVYNEILVHMEFTDDQLLDYSTSEREDLLVQINVFFANIGQVKPQDYVQVYDDLLKLLYERFGLQEAFAGYFPQYNSL